MADEKVTELTELTAIDDGDLIPVVDAPTGTPVLKKITRTNYLLDQVKINLKDATELTLDTNGAITITQSWHTVDTFEDAASDNLVTINGGVEGDLLFLRPENDGRTIVVDHDADNISCVAQADITCDEVEDFVILIYDAGLTKWLALQGGGGSGLSDIVDDVTPELGGDLDLNNKRIIMNIETTASDDAEGIIADVTVDSNSTGIGCPLFISAAGNYDEADADSENTAPAIAIALEAGTGTKEVMFFGTLRHDAWAWVTGPGQASNIYLSTTVGTLTQTIPTGADDVVQHVGWALSDDQILWNPSGVWFTHTG